MKEASVAAHLEDNISVIEVVLRVPYHLGARLHGLICIHVGNSATGR